MIRVKVSLDNSDNIKALSITDHANELICAGVSSCFVGAINAIQEIDNFNYRADIGDSFIAVKNSINEHDKVVLETLYIQLLTIAEEYKKEIKIFRERV